MERRISSRCRSRPTRTRVLAIDLKLAERSKNPKRVKVATPIVAAPVMLAEWKLEPDTAQRLVYRDGSLTPVGGVADVSGFAGLARMFGRRDAGTNAHSCSPLRSGCSRWRWRSGAARCAPDVLQIQRALTGSGVLLGASPLRWRGSRSSCLPKSREHSSGMPRGVTFLAPVQQAGSALSVEVGNRRGRGVRRSSWIGCAWPALLALARVGVCVARGAKACRGRSSAGRLLAWAALRWPNGAGAFLVVVALFAVWQIAVPALRRLWQMPRKPRRPTPHRPPPGRRDRCRSGAARCSRDVTLAQDAATFAAKEPPVAETRHAADSRRRKVRARDGQNPLAGGEGPAAAAAL